jgi:hypothetical protein
MYLMNRGALLVAVILAACAPPSDPSSATPSGSAEPVPSAVVPSGGGIHWDLVEDPDLFPGMFNAMATSGDDVIGGGIACTVSGDCQPAIWMSSNGLEWVRVADVPAGESETIITAVGHGPNGWAAFVDGFAWFSADARSWVLSPTRDAFDGLADGGPPYRTEVEGDCCSTTVAGVAHVGGAYVAVGAVTCYDCIGRAAIWRSDDLLRWERLPYAALFEGVPLSAVAALPSGRLVAVGNRLALVSDDQGATWEPSAAFGAGYATELTIVADELLAAGISGEAYEGAFWRSSDGVTWEPLTVQISLPEAIPRTLGSVGGSVLLAGETREPEQTSERGFMAVSADLLRWRTIPVESDTDFRIWSFAEVDGLIVAAGNITGEGQHPAGVWVLR